MTDHVKQIKDSIRQTQGPKRSGLFLSSGCTLLNLALTGKTGSCWEAGSYYLLVGDSRSGKTFILLQSFAEAANNPKFDKYELVFFAPERGAKMDITRFFGKKLAERLKWVYPKTLDEFYFLLDNLVSTGPVVAGLDSWDALDSSADLEKFTERKSAFAKGKEITGTYGTSKAKQNSSDLRIVHNKLEEHGSILLGISQTRHNIGFGSQFNPKTRAGGDALTFFADGEMWFSVGESVKRTVRGKPRKIGSVLTVKIKKNRDTGREPTIDLRHFPSVGFDDVGSVCQWLVDEGVWSETKGIIDAGTFGKGSLDKLVEEIESAGKEKELRMLAAQTWTEIESACSVTRKKRYQ